MTPLEALESLMTNYYEMCQDLGNNDDQYQKWNLTSERAIIEKSLKALETIKKKEVNMLWLYCSFELNCSNEEQCKNYNYQWKYLPDKENHYLTQEEYDLLKKVLL